MREVVGGLLDELPERLREPMILYFYAEQSQEVIARSLGVSKMAVSRRLKLGRQHLLRGLSRLGIRDASVLGAVPLSLTHGPTLSPPAGLTGPLVYSKLQASLAAIESVGAGGAIGLAVHAHLVWLPFAIPAAIVIGLTALVWSPLWPSGGSRAVIRGGGFGGWVGWTVSGKARPVARNRHPAFETAAEGANVADWVSPSGWLPYQSDSIYRIEAQVRSDQTQADSTPLWQLAVEDDGGGAQGPLVGETLTILDNVGGANSVALGERGGRRTFEAWLISPEATNPDWAEIERRAAHPLELRLRFKLEDDNRGGIMADRQKGEIELEWVRVERYRRQDLKIEQLVYDSGPIPGDQPTGISRVSRSGGNAPALFEPGSLVFAPPEETRFAPAEVRAAPGDDKANLMAGDSLADNWPIPWQADQLYLAQADLSATGDVREDSRLECIRLGIDSATSEVGAVMQYNGGWSGALLPGPGAEQTYSSLFFSHSPSRLNLNGQQFGLRPWLDVRWRDAPVSS